MPPLCLLYSTNATGFDFLVLSPECQCISHFTTKGDRIQNANVFGVFTIYSQQVTSLANKLFACLHFIEKASSGNSFMLGITVPTSTICYVHRQRVWD
jgi:hypothetical protein